MRKAQCAQGSAFRKIIMVCPIMASQTLRAATDTPNAVELATVAVDSPGTLSLMTLAILALLIGRKRS